MSANGDGDTSHLNFPFEEVLARAQKLAAEGVTVYQKFTCVNCGNRLTMEEPNTFYVEGTCDNCGALTDIRATGCNYVMLIEILERDEDG